MTEEVALQMPLMPVSAKTPKIRRMKLEELPANENLRIPAGHPLPEFIQSIYEDGQIKPITVMTFDDGRMHVADGKRRIATFRILAERFPEDKRWKRITASLSEEESYEVAIRSTSIANNQRHENALSDLDTIRFIRDKYPTITKSELARRTGINPSTLARRMKLLKLVQPWGELFEGGELILSIAENIAGHTPEMQFKLWALYQEKGKITQTMIKEVQKVRKTEAAEERQDVLFPELKPQDGDANLPVVHPDQTPTNCPYCGQDMPNG